MICRAFSLCLLLVLAACARGPAAPPAPFAAQIPAAPRRGEPQGYADLGVAQVRAAFGTPAFVRRDGVTQMWRYDGAACKAFFFLYGQAGQEVVRHVETLPRGTADAADPACLNALKRPVS